jgi:predicted RNase H-like HicB family nuclease
MRTNAVFEPTKESGLTVHVPELPGCVSEEDKFEEAVGNIKEVVELYIEKDD